jgi:hypothetical protein
MLNYAYEPAVDLSWIPSSTWRCLRSLEEKRFAQEKGNFLDDVPVMSATVLGLEVALHEPYIDLRKASDLVLSDVGATIHTLRLVGREYEFASERPGRMGDCIASLDLGAWFSAISARTFPCDQKHAATTAFWEHCRLIAQYAQLVAESLEGISPEDAYLFGLLHEAGSIPAVLGWPKGGPGAADPGSLFAMEGALPLFVLAALRSVRDCCPLSAWKFILTAAHELADTRPNIKASRVLTIGSR